MLRRLERVGTMIVVPVHPIMIMTYKTVATTATVIRVLPDVPAIIAVVVAVFTGLAVAWQSWLTRRATNVSTKALIAAQAVAIDTARARLDANAPLVRLEVSMEWPPFDSAKSPTGVGGGLPRPIPVTQRNHEQWHLPSDKRQQVCVRFTVKIDNVGDRPAYLKYDPLIGPRIDQEPFGSPPRMVAVGQQISCLLQANLTLEQWAENWQNHQDGKPLRTVSAKIECSDDSDTCAMDTWELTVTGWPVEQRGEGIWGLSRTLSNGDDVMQFESLPYRERSYWISRLNGIPLPQPTYGGQ